MFVLNVKLKEAQWGQSCFLGIRDMAINLVNHIVYC